jgi:peptidoglycan/xylan/chitin deacetylase (PgdA/CDA1 family)
MVSQDVQREKFIGRAGRFGLIISILGLGIVVALLAACAPTPAAEPGLLPSTIPATEPALLAEPMIQTLPTAAATLTQPPMPTPLPVALPDATAALMATRAAAAAPPTPPVMPVATGHALSAEPLPTPSGVYSWTLKVPILMYHYVSEPPADADKYRVDLSVTPDQFRQQMAYLRDSGYTPVDLYALSMAIVGYADLPDKPVILTFDDGYLDNYYNAYPILEEFGFSGTFFIITEFVDKGAEGYMSWPMIEELARAGHRIESHSRTHPDLTEKDHDDLIWQILGAQETLAAHVGYRPRYFCYPGGDYDDETIQLLQELDYWGAVTTADGSWHGFNNRFAWHRIRIHNFTPINEFIKLVDLEDTVGGKPPA